MKNTKIKRNPQWIICTSSYDRYLEHLLNIWPEVKKEVQEAQLHVFYGWQLFDQFNINNPERMAWRRKMSDLMEKLKGVIHHGRVSQPEMEKWYKQCGIWAYPSHFYEINCISAIKAQLWGCIPVTTDIGALNETVQYGVKIKGDIWEKGVIKEYARELIKMLKNPLKGPKINKMKKWARNKYSWDKIAKDWQKEVLT